MNRRGWEDWGFPSTGSSRPVRWAGGLPRREPAGLGGLGIPQHRLFRPVRWAGGLPRRRTGGAGRIGDSPAPALPGRCDGPGDCPAVPRRGWAHDGPGDCPAVPRRGWAHPPAPALPGRCDGPGDCPAVPRREPAGQGGLGIPQHRLFQAGAMGRGMPRREPAGLGASPSTGSSRPVRWAGGLPRRRTGGAGRIGDSPAPALPGRCDGPGDCPAVEQAGLGS